MARSSSSQHNGPYRSQPVAPASTETKITAAAMPAGGVGWTGWLSAIWYALAGVASGATDSGNPIKVSGVFNTASPTFTSGQRTDLQTNSNGSLKVTLMAGGTTSITTTAPSDGFSNASNSIGVFAFGAMFNGTTWDRNRKPNATSIIASAAATTNPTVAKASAGDLWTIHGHNAAAAVRYIKIFNKATAPVTGTDTPVMVLACAPSVPFRFDLDGHYLSAGISYALTVNPALLDNTAVTAADIVGLTISYA